MSKKDKEPEMIIEIAGEEPKADSQPADMQQAGAEAQADAEVQAGAEAQAGAGKQAEPEQRKEPKEEKPSALQRMKESASEDDDAPVGTLTLKQIVGGDYLFAMVRHHVALIMLVVLMLVIYVGVRYQCEQDVLEINQLEKDLVDAKYKAMSSSSNLTELCRQSNVLKVLRESQDTLLQLSDQPPFIIEIPEE
ncbi:MAG: hypothetical protein IJT53_01080 [Prevotella sp.]|nr:hypothetical protein [Prevotella sp.]